jgi:hypothetical protein
VSKASALPIKPLVKKKQMSRSTKPNVPEKADDKEQSEAFIKAAQEAETNEDRDAFEKAFRKVAGAKTHERKYKKR